MERKRLLITGCGRSGTLFAAALWQRLGLDIRHERPVPPNGVMGADGVASWFMAADDPEPPSGPSACNFRFDIVLHQVRHPLKVIASMAQFILRQGKRAPGYIERNAPATILSPDECRQLASREQLLLKASRYWLHWNLMAETKADRLVRIEDLDAELPGLCDLVGVAYRPDVLQSISKDLNARSQHVPDPPWRLEWEEIKKLDARLYADIRALARHYGYKE